MAVVTEMEQLSGVMPPPNGTEPPKRKGRPPGSRNKVEEVAVDDDPSVDPHLKAHKEDIWATVANISDWTYEFAYLYRLSPTIDRRSAGRQINIDKFACAFDPEDIKKKHGSGCYRICLFHIDPASNKYFKYRDEKIDILDMDYPPNVPPGDWVNEPANEVWKWAAPKIQATQQQNGGNMYPPGFNMKELLDSSFQMAKQMTPPAVPVREDKVLTTILEKLLDASLRPAPVAAPVEDTATKSLISFLEKQNDRLDAELKLLRAQITAPPPQKTLIEQMKEIQPAVTGFMEMMGDRKSNNWWDSPVVQTLAEGLAEAVPAALETFAKSSRAAAPNAWTPQLPAATPGPQHTQPQQQQPAPQPHVNAQPQAQPEPDQPNLTDEQRAFMEICRKWGMFIVQIAPQMIENFKHPDGYGGFDFRDWFLEWHGMLSWSNMRREIGPAVLGQMIADHPQLSLEIFPEEARSGFCQQFFALPEEDQEEQTPGDGVIEIQGGSDAA